MALLWLCAAVLLAAVTVFVWMLCTAADAAEARMIDRERFITPAATPVPAPEERETYLIWPGVPLEDSFQRYIGEQARAKDVPAALVLAIIARESDFDPGLVGDEGRSYGLMQIQPFWHGERMERLGVIDLLDPSQNVRVGIDYLAELLAEGKGIEWAVMAYNGGYDHADYFTGLGVMSGYCADVMRMFDCMSESALVIGG